MNRDDADRHYDSGDLLERILAGLDLAGKSADALTVRDLAPVDAFHTRGRKGTDEVAGLTELGAAQHVLDVGCGLGGTARHLASEFGCRVTGIDLTDEYIVVGRELNAMVGLNGMVDLQQGSALELPFDDDAFDVAWTEHVQMNIADKERFYGEIARVLKPGGCFLFHDVFRGEGGEVFYPTPWASEASLSHLARVDEAQKSMAETGLVIEVWRNKDEASLEFFRKAAARIAERGLPPLGIHLLMGDDAARKLENYVRNIDEGRVTVVLGSARV